jgi:hypothetical protein
LLWRPRIFIGSANASIEVARLVAKGLQAGDVPVSVVWDENVFRPNEAVLNPNQPVQYAYLGERQPTRRYLQCKICDQGALTSKKIFRMSVPVVLIGFILLVPSVLGMIFSALMLLGVFAADGAASVGTRNEAVSEMRNNDVPEPIIAAVVNKSKFGCEYIDGSGQYGAIKLD